MLIGKFDFLAGEIKKALREQGSSGNLFTKTKPALHLQRLVLFCLPADQTLLRRFL